MRGKLPINNGKFKFKEYIVHCHHPETMLTTYDGDKPKLFRYGGKLDKNFRYKSWDIAEECRYFTNFLK